MMMMMIVVGDITNVSAAIITMVMFTENCIL